MGKSNRLDNGYGRFEISTSVPESSKAEMREVARLGGGRHYHADTGDQLVKVFEEIANNMPTIITE